MHPFLLAIDTSYPKIEVIAEATSSLATQAPEAAPEPKPTAKKADSFPYLGLQLGVGAPNSHDGNFHLLGIAIDTTLDLSAGFNGEVALGYQFNQARAELAVGYGNYGVDQQTFDGGSIRIPGSGEVKVTTVMLNGYYDIPIRNSKGVRSRWSPYIGAGIGYATINTPACGRSDCFAGGSTNGFAYQGKLGLSYRVAESSFAFLEGGYMGATSGSIDGVDFDDFGAWRVNVGFRIGFGGAAKAKSVVQVQEVQPEPQVIAPAPAPAPADQPAMPIRGLW